VGEVSCRRSVLLPIFVTVNNAILGLLRDSSLCNIHVIFLNRGSNNNISLVITKITDLT